MSRLTARSGPRPSSSGPPACSTRWFCLLLQILMINIKRTPGQGGACQPGSIVNREGGFTKGDLQEWICLNEKRVKIIQHWRLDAHQHRPRLLTKSRKKRLFKALRL